MVRDVMGHLGSRASALLDGQLPPEESERAWAHVYSCHACRDLVEREGWIKSRLAGLSFDVAAPSTPAGLKGALIGADRTGPLDGPLNDPLDETALSTRGPVPSGHRRRNAGLAAIGGGAAGAAVVGVLVFGVAPADAPTPDRRAPSTINRTEVPPTPTTTHSVAWNLLRGTARDQRR